MFLKRPFDDHEGDTAKTFCLQREFGTAAEPFLKHTNRCFCHSRFGENHAHLPLRFFFFGHLKARASRMISARRAGDGLTAASRRTSGSAR